LIVLAELAFCVFPFRGGKDIEVVNMNEKNLFMRGTKSVAIISAVASTGVSLQADKRQENQVIKLFEFFFYP
jgi:hypothetical protein